MTVIIRDKTLVVKDGQIGDADLHVAADSQTWLPFLRKESSIIWAILTRKIRVRDSLRLLKAFGT